MFNQSTDFPVITLSARGGYVPPDYAFLDEAPYLVVYGNGRFHRREDDAKTRIARWNEGEMTLQQTEELIQALGQLGSWSWDTKAIQARIGKQKLITDLPTTSLTIVLSDREKTFSCYGLQQYAENYSMPELVNPLKATQKLEGLTPTRLAQPASVDTIAVPVDAADASQLKGVQPWPLADLAVVPSITKVNPAGHQSTFRGDAAKQITNVLSGGLYFSINNQSYVVRYRPSAGQAKQ